MLEKDFIRKSSFSYVVLILIIKKLDDNLRICVDYRAFNAIIIRNYNISSLIREILSRLYRIK